jgi:hypothetical protein
VSKRRNGECSIFAYRNGYAAYAWVTTPDRERKRKWVCGNTHDEVHAKWIKLQSQAAEGPVPTSVPSLAVAVLECCTATKTADPLNRNRPLSWVGDTGIEPVTSSV